MRVRLAYTSATLEFTELRPRRGKTSLLHKAKVVTEAWLKVGSDSAVIGVAYTSRKDTHDPFIGRKLALQRALASASHSLATEDRLRIWIAFFARELEAERKKPRFEGAIHDGLVYSLPKGRSTFSGRPGYRFEWGAQLPPKFIPRPSPEKRATR